MKRLKTIGIIILVMVLMSIICSCGSIQYVPVESVRTEVLYKDRIQRDSVHVTDSLFVFMKGDTVYRERFRTEYKNRLVRDTAFLWVRDSIAVPYPVEKQLTRWQRLRLELGGWAMAGLLVAVVAAVWLGCRKTNC